MKHLSLIVIAVAASAFALGCDMNKVDPGGGASSPTAVSLRGSIESGPGGSGTAGGGTGGAGPVVTGDPGTLIGRVVLNGSIGDLAPLVAQGTSKVDPTVCAKDGAIPDQSFVLGPEGGVQNVFIFLAKTPKGMEFEAPESQEVLDQKICIFNPHGLIWRTGIDVTLRNSDAVPHNVQLLTQKNGSPNNTLPAGTEGTALFKKAEPQPFEAKCAFHPWMKFYALVVDHPFAAVTDEKGNFKIPNLPAGKHTFRVWHERGKMLETKLTVEVKPAPEETTLELKYEPAKFNL